MSEFRGQRLWPHRSRIFGHHRRNQPVRPEQELVLLSYHNTPQQSPHKAYGDCCRVLVANAHRRREVRFDHGIGRKLQPRSTNPTASKLATLCRSVSVHPIRVGKYACQNVGGAAYIR